MTELTERKLGWGFGIAGGVLLFAAALVALIIAVADLAVSRPVSAATSATEAILFFVVGGLALLFSHLGYRSWSDRPIVSGVLLVVIAIVGWAVLGLATHVLALAGALFVFLAGVLYLVGPLARTVDRAVTA